MNERYHNLFNAAKELAWMHEESFLPGIVGDTGELNVCIKSPVFEYEDFLGGREVFLRLLDNCDKLDFILCDNEMITMVASVEED